MQVKSHAKVNLVLDLLRKRADGYHEVEFVMQELALHDILSIQEISSGIELTCSNPAIPLDEKNLCWKAIKRMQEVSGTDSGIKIHIEKNIPLAGGVGGGSSNGAATLKTLNELWNAKLSEKQLIDLAATFGSDTCFFILGKTCIAKGRGEKLEKISDCPKMFLVIVDPEIKTPKNKTQWIYSNFCVEKVKRHPSIEKMRKAIESKNVNSVALQLGNVFHSLTIPEYKQARELLKELKKDSLNAIMAGAGPTCFAVLETKKQALDLKQKMLEKYSKVYLTETFNP